MEWSTWTDCSLSCGSGKQSRSRICVGPFYGGSGCDGSFQDNRTCNDHHCPGKQFFFPWYPQKIQKNENYFYHHNHIDNFLVRLNYSWWSLGWLGSLEGLWCHMRWWKSDTWTHMHGAILRWCPMQRFLEWYTRVQHVPMSR